MTGLQDIQTRLNQAVGIIDGFRRNVIDGQTVDLAGLDHAMAETCDAIATLPPDERITLKSTLVSLMDEMDALVKSLESKQQSISDDLNGVSSRQQAVSAYGKGVATVNQLGNQPGNQPGNQAAQQSGEPETE